MVWRPWEGYWYYSRYYDHGWYYYHGIPFFYFDIDPVGENITGTMIGTDTVGTTTDPLP